MNYLSDIAHIRECVARNECDQAFADILIAELVKRENEKTTSQKNVEGEG